MAPRAQTDGDGPSTSINTITCNDYRIRRSPDNPSKFIISRLELGKELVDSTGRLQATLDWEFQTPRCLRRNEKATMYVQNISSGPTSIRFPLITVEYPDIGLKYSLTGTDGLAQWFYDEIPTSGDTVALESQTADQFGTITSMFEAHRFKMIPQDLAAISLRTVSLHRRFENLHTRQDSSCPGGFAVEHQHLQVQVFMALDHNVPGPIEGPGTQYTNHSICNSKKLSEVFESLSGGELNDNLTLAQLRWEGVNLLLRVGRRYTYHEAKNGPLMNLATAWAKNVWPPPPTILERDRIDLCLMAFESPEQCENFRLRWGNYSRGGNGRSGKRDGNGKGGKRDGDGKGGGKDSNGKGRVYSSMLYT